MKRVRIVQAVFALFLMILPLLSALPCPAAQQTLTKTLAGPTWLLDDAPPPKTLWSPWAPLPTQYLIRYAMGFRFSTGTVAVRCPVKVTVRYDDAEAKGGETLTLHVKAEPVASLGGNDNQRTFDAGFGVGLPSKIQVGFVSISGLPDILPWKDLPLDFWGIVSLIPEVGGTIASAASNVGVYMDSSAPCPLGASVEHHDERELISLDLKDLITDADTGNKPKDLATKVWDKIPGPVKTAVVTGIKTADWVNDQTAQTRAIDLIADGLALVTSAGELSLSADPYWRVQGEKLVVLLRYRIPGRMLSGNMPLTFTAPGQEQTIQVPLPAFVNDQNNLEILVDEVEYTFKLYQSMTAQITFSSMLDFSLGETEKLVRYPQARAQFTAGNDLHVPLAPPDETVVDYRARGGFKALIVYFSTPAMPVKATADVYKGTVKVKSVTETSLRMAHSIIVAGLEADTGYSVKLSYVDSAGNAYAHDESADCRTKTGTQKDVYESNLSQGDETMSVPSISYDQTSASFGWASSRPGSTFVYISPLDDFNLYTSAVKHEGGRVSVGDCTAEEGQPEMVYNHTITVPDLEPGTTYQYFARTWFYKNDDPTDNPDWALGYRGSFTTQAAPQPPQATLQLLAFGHPQAGLPVVLTRTSPAPVETANLVTGQDGKTPVFAMTPGGQYRAAVVDQACVQDGVLTWTAPGSAGTSPANTLFNLNPRPHTGGRVVDAAGNPLSGAIVHLTGKFQAVQTDSQGRFLPQGAIPAPGSYTLNVGKTGYIDTTMRATVDACGLVTAETCVLTPSTSTVTIRVLHGNDQPLSGAQVALCPPSQPTNCQPAGTTNSQGVTTATFNFSANQAVQQLVNAEPRGSVGMGFLPGQQAVTLVPGENPTIEVYCGDKPPPEVSAFSAAQKGNLIRVQVSSPSVIRAALEYQSPDGQTRTTALSANTTSSHTLEIPGCVSGTYKVRAKIQDLNNRQSVSDWREVRYWSAADWNLQATDLHVTDARLTWDKYDGPSGFKGYVLTVAGQNPVTVSGQGTLNKVLADLTPNQPTTVSIHAKDAEGDPMTETAQVTFTTVNQPPVIDNVTLTPDKIGLEQQAELRAVISDPDGKLARVLVRDASGKSVYDKKGGGSSTAIKVKITPDQPGDLVYRITAEDEYDATEAAVSLRVVRIEVPEFKLTEAPDKTEILTDWTARLQILNTDQLSGSLTLAAAWDKEPPRETALPDSVLAGDGAFPLTHSFEDAGKHQASLTLTAESEGLSFTSKPVKVQVTTFENPPELALTCSGDGPDKVFHVTVRPGSLDIARWTLDFGDKSLSPQVQGAADQDVPHTYGGIPGQKFPKTATAVLTAWDVRGKEHKVSLRVSNQVMEQQSSRDDAGTDLSLTARLPTEAKAGQELVLKAVVKNGSRQDLSKIVVVLLVDGREEATADLDLAAGKKSEVRLTYAPAEPGTVELALEVRPPRDVTDPKPGNNRVQGTLTVSAP